MVGLTTAETRTDGAESTATPASTSIDVGAGGAVVLPEGFPLTDAAFGRVGPNLVLTADDGAQVVLRGYFSVEPAPNLMSANGLSVGGDVAVRLAGDPAHGALAQAGVGGVGEPVGAIDQVAGEVVITRADGSKVLPKNGDALYRGDVIETGKDGAVGVVLADQTSIGLGDDARLLIDDLVYDPGTQQGSLQLSFLKGVATFVSGEIAKTAPDAMIVETPAATLGIRGTQVNVRVDDKGVLVVLDKEADESVGEVTISNDNGIQTINSAYAAVTVTHSEGPTLLGTWNVEQVREVFGDSLLTLPQIGSANDHGLRDVGFEPASSTPPAAAGSEGVVGSQASFTKPLGDGPVGDTAIPAAIVASEALDDGEPEGALSGFGKQTVVDLPPTQNQSSAPVVSDTIVGTSGDDEFAFDLPGSVSVNQGPPLSLNGIQVVDGLGGTDTAVFGDAADVLTAAAALPVGLKNIENLHTGGGDDVVSLAALPDSMRTIDLGDGNDTVTAGDGPAVASASVDVGFTIDAGSGNDAVSGGSGNDTIYGGAGDDLISGGAGNDVMIGGSGNDTYIVDSAGDQVIEASGEGTDTVASFVDYELGADTENLTLLGGDDLKGVGNDLANVLTGNEGDNVLEGGGGNDVIFGGDGNDVIRGGFGADVVDGGAGDDTLEFVADGEGFQWSTAYRAFDTGSGPGNPGSGESVPVGGLNRVGDIFVGGDGNDTLVGTAGGDAVFLDDSFSPGGTGPRLVGVETIMAGGGNDVVDLTSSRFAYGNVTIYGGDGNDVLWASAGDDVLVGGSGSDSLRGGAGNDTFLFSAGDGSDTVLDFGLGDRIVLKGFSEGDIESSANGNGWQFTAHAAGGDGDVHITVKNAEQFGGYSITTTGTGDGAVTTITHTANAAA